MSLLAEGTRVENKTAILLTGDAKAGKSTAIQRIVETLGEGATGFYTREIQGSGDRLGFEVVVLNGGGTAPLATRSPPVLPSAEIVDGVAGYCVFPDAVLRLCVPVLRAAVGSGRVVVVDEIGPMQLHYPEFVRAVYDLLDSGTLVVASIVYRSHPVADRIKDHERVRCVMELNERNRDGVPDEVLRLLRGTLENN